MTRRMMFIPLLLGIFLCPLGCSEDSPTTTPAGDQPADMQTYLGALPAWEEFSPPLPDVDLEVGDTETTLEIVDNEDGSTSDYNCSSTPYSITKTPDKVVTLNPDAEILWPGVLLQGDGHRGGIGSLGELPIRQRTPLTISIDLLAADNTRTVTDPDLASVNQAVGELVEAATLAGNVAGSSLAYDQVTTRSVEQAAIGMGFSASYYGATIKTELKASVSAKTTTITAHFTQRMFTVSTVLPQQPGAWFSDTFTENLKQEQIDLGRMGPENLPVFVSSVSYGRLLMFTLTSERTEAELKNTVEAMYADIGVGVGSEFREILDSCEITLVAIGGDATSALAAIQSGKLSDYFAEDSPLTSGRPLSYTIRNLADNSIARVSETTDYNLTQCTPADVAVTGHTYRITLQHFDFVDAGTIFGGPLNNCGLCGLVFNYTIDIVQDTGICEAANGRSGNLLFCEGEQFDIRRGDSVCSEVDNSSPYMDVDLHYDGRESVQAIGEIGILEWKRTWRGTMATGNRRIRNSTKCGILPISKPQVIDLRYNVQIIDDLFD